jgi:hypothetical protein
MDPEQRKKRMVGIIIGCVVGVAVIIVIAWWLWLRSSTGTPASSEGNTTSTSGMTSVSFSQDIYTIALQRAQSWQSDAALMTVTSGDVSGQVWNFIFSSKKMNGQTFAITVNGQTVVSATTSSLSGSGAPIPQNLISPNQALAKTHAVPGNATTAVQSLQLIYNANTKQWYWGAKTSSGFTTSIKATP